MRFLRIISTKEKVMLLVMGYKFFGLFANAIYQ